MQEAILVLANRLPWPVDDGWKRRTYHVLRALSDHGPVTLLVFHRSGQSDVEALRDAVPGSLDIVCVRPSRLTRMMAVPLGLITATPFPARRVQSHRFTREVRRLHEERRFRIAIAELTHLYQHLRVLPDACRRIIDTHNIDSIVMARYAENLERNPAWRWYARRTARQLRAQELRDYGAASAVWVCSETEAEWVRKHVPGATAQVIPNGVDTEAFRPDDWPPAQGGRLVFFGRMDYHPNADAAAWFADEILPLIHARCPGAELTIVGPGERAAVRALAARPGVRVMGPVPDVRPVVASAAAVVVPLRSGGGTRLKILEALALGRPVITTPVGMEGLTLSPERDLLVADDAPAFAAAVIRVLEDRALADALGRNGAAAVSAYAWSEIEHAIRTALAPHPPV